MSAVSPEPEPPAARARTPPRAGERLFIEDRTPPPGSPTVGTMLKCISQTLVRDGCDPDSTSRGLLDEGQLLKVLECKLNHNGIVRVRFEVEQDGKFMECWASMKSTKGVEFFTPVPTDNLFTRTISSPQQGSRVLRRKQTGMMDDSLFIGTHTELTDATRGMHDVALVILGKERVGKSCLQMRYAGNLFRYQYEPNAGAGYREKTTVLGMEHAVCYRLWDTAGLPRYQALAPMYYRAARAALVVYDVTDKDSYAQAWEWIKKLQNAGPEGLTIALCGNKTDLLHDGPGGKTRCEGIEKVHTDCREKNLIYKEVSALTGENVSALFQEIGLTVISQVGKLLESGSMVLA